MAWRQATGAPADPQAGNIPGGKRDVLRSANFNGDQTMGFIAETGKWQVTVTATSPEGKSMHKGHRSFYYVYKMMLSILVTVLRPRSGRHD